MSQIKKVKFLFSFFSFFIFLVMLFVLTNVASANSLETNNPYVSAYKNEKTSSKVEMDPLADPDIEEQIILETLKEYYDEDIKVAEILSTMLSDKSVQTQTTSINREDKIKTMHKIIDNFSELNDGNSRSMVVDYLERYVLGPEGLDEETHKFLNALNDTEIHSEVEAETSATYNRAGAGNWAYKNYNKYSKSYPKFTGKFGTDCTNFVSQAMHHGGGKPKSGKWSISKKTQSTGKSIVLNN